MKAHHTRRIVGLVADATGVIYREAFGLADREEGISNRPEALYPVYSITKSFSAVLVLQLVDEGRIRLDGTLDEYLFSLPSSWRNVTIHQLLSHRSGVPDYFYGSSPVYTSCNGRTLSREALLEEMEARSLEFPPGERFAYSNTGYLLLGLVIEAVTGMPYGEALRDRILDPLGMTETRWASSLRDTRIVRQYLSKAGSPAPLSIVHAGQSGIVSTLDDMFLFVRALGSPELLSPELWRLAFSTHSLPEEASLPIPPHLSEHGYGFALANWPAAPEETERAVLHGGSGCGGTALYYRLIEREQLVILWNNHGDVQPDPALAVEILSFLQ